MLIQTNEEREKKTYVAVGVESYKGIAPVAVHMYVESKSCVDQCHAVTPPVLQFNQHRS